MLNEALGWRQMNISVMPFKPEGKKFDKYAAKQRGFNFHDFEKRLPSVEDLEFWFSGRRKLALMTTPNFICVDFDSLQSYYHFYALCPSLNQTFTVKTRRGYHFYFFLDEPINKPVKVDWPDTELKRNGQSIITHGNGYQVINDSLPLRLKSIFDLPFVKEVRQTIAPSKERRTPFSFTRCNGLGPIQRIKRTLPISTYLADLGYELKKTGEGKYLCLCPFHADRSPSFWIVEPICNCFSCEFDKPMDILDLHQKLNGCSLNIAIKQLADSLGF